MEVREKLKGMAEEGYRAFHQKLCPGTENIMGIRVGNMRNFAKEIVKGDWREYLKGAKYDYYEEILLAGLVTGCAKTEIEEKLSYVEAFVPRIDNWAICDTFCSSLKDVNKNKARVWEFLMPYLDSDKEFELRFAVVMLMDYYVDEEHLKELFRIFDSIKREGYYVKMAAAWAISVCFVHFPRETMRYLKKNQLDFDTVRKAYQKILESHRVSAEDKEKIRGMRNGLKG